VTPASTAASSEFCICDLTSLAFEKSTAANDRDCGEREDHGEIALSRAAKLVEQISKIPKPTDFSHGDTSNGCWYDAVLNYLRIRNNYPFLNRQEPSEPTVIEAFQRSVRLSDPSSLRRSSAHETPRKQASGASIALIRYAPAG
jgi:hypothetical protein